MGVLFRSENGVGNYLIAESISRRRRARKCFRLPSVHGPAVLFVHISRHAGCCHTLHVEVDGIDHPVFPDRVSGTEWLCVPLETGLLREGENSVVFWSDNRALDGWNISIDTATGPKNSALSLDGGNTFQDAHMTTSLHCRGEYLVRVFFPEMHAEAGAAPPFIWESRDCPWFDDLRRIIPSDVRDVSGIWERACALKSWVSEQWTYRHNGDGIDYAPWDPLTILSWGNFSYGVRKPDPIVMCVHFAVVFTSAALALGIPSRAVCCTRNINKGQGHFVSEVWVEQFNKWCQIDANLDYIYIRNGLPLSVADMSAAGEGILPLVERGPGFGRQPRVVQAMGERSFVTGRAFRKWAVWPRNDFLSRPQDCPGSHGAGAYAETAWLWARPGKQEDLDDLQMFPHILDPELLAAPPPDEWRQT